MIRSPISERGNFNMKRLMTATALACLIASPALAQSATGTGIGVSGSNSESAAQSNNAGIGNSNATGVGTGVATSGSTSASGALAAGNQVNISSPATQTINSNSRVSGSTTVKTNPSLALGLAAAGLETCLGSASGGLSLAGFGAVGGSTYTDEGCQARLDSRTLWSYGLKGAAVARLCSRADMWRAMPYECERYWPQGVPYPAGIVVSAPRAQITMSADGAGGSMRVIDGRDGVEKDCLNYSATKQKCYQWSGEPLHRSMVRTATVTPRANVQKPERIVVKPKPPSAVAKPADPKVEPKAEDKPKT